MSLVNHNYQYNIYCDNFIANAVFVSGISYSKRHFEMVKNCDKSTAAKHIALGIVELLPVIGAIVAIFERIIISRMSNMPGIPKSEEKDIGSKPLEDSEEQEIDQDPFLVMGQIFDNAIQEQSAHSESKPTSDEFIETEENEIPTNPDLKDFVELVSSRTTKAEPDSEEDQFVLIPSQTPDDIEKSFVNLNHAKIEDLDSLLTYQDLGDGAPIIGLNQILSEENWNDLLDINDLSYDIAKLDTVHENKRERVNQHAESLKEKLRQKGWDNIHVLIGKTGISNKEDDATCIVLVNKEKNLVYVAFHGSRNGSKINFFDGKGDWGANRDSKLVSAKKEGLYGAPEGVRFHRGFGLNFISVQNTLLEKLEEVVSTLPGKPNIIVTGHSKGGGLANIAVPAITEYFKDKNIQAHVGAVTFSAPMAFNQAGSNWVHTAVKIRNILRVKVIGDPVTYGSWFGKDYAHVGIRLRERVQDVNRRTAEWHGKKKVGLMEGFINYHYGANRNGSWCFVPEIVMRQWELMKAFNEWNDSLKKEKRSFYEVAGFVPSSI